MTEYNNKINNEYGGNIMKSKSNEMIFIKNDLFDFSDVQNNLSYKIVLECPDEEPKQFVASEQTSQLFNDYSLFKPTSMEEYTVNYFPSRLNKEEPKRGTETGTYPGSLLAIDYEKEYDIDDKYFYVTLEETELSEEESDSETCFKIIRKNPFAEKLPEASGKKQKHYEYQCMPGSITRTFKFI